MSRIYLVTGAAGYLGVAVCEQLVANGQKVRALVLEGDRCAQYIPKEVEQVTGDVLNVDSLENFFQVEEEEIIVLHIASIITVNPDFSQIVYNVNVKGTANIIELCKKKNVKKMVYCSSTTTIPDGPMGTSQTEVDHYEPSKVVGCYAQTKAEASQLVLDACKDGFPGTIVQPSGIFGPGDYVGGQVFKFIRLVAKGLLPVAVAGGFNVVDVRDLAAGVISAGDKGRNGESYILANSSITMYELFNEVAKQAGKPKIRVTLSEKMLHALVKPAAIFFKLTKQTNLLTEFSIYNLVRNNEYSSYKARTELGFTTRPVPETIKDTLDWMKKEGKY